MSVTDQERRMHLLKHNRAAVMVMLGKARGEGKGSALVAIVADTTDVIGRDIASAFAEKSDPSLDVGAEARRVQARGEIPTFVVVVPLALAATGFALSHPNIAKGLGQPARPGALPIVLVGSGGATLVHVAAEPTSSRGRA
jgi:hypothetical protein